MRPLRSVTGLNLVRHDVACVTGADVQSAIEREREREMPNTWPELALSEDEKRSLARRIPRLMDQSGECWVWIGNKFATGYGSIKQRNRRMLAHRVTYAAMVGPIPANMTLDHLCRNLPCVNPAHMEIVTLGVNMLRGTSPTALNKRKTHCLKGHELTESNLVPNRGCRECLTCHRRRGLEQRRAWMLVPENRARHAANQRARTIRKKALETT